MAKDSYRRLKIGIIGCGNMGAAIARGLVERACYPQNILVADSEARKAKNLKRELNIRIARSNRQVASIVDALILAVKPQIMDAVLDEIALTTSKTTLVLSIAAGVPLKRLQKPFKERVPIVRVMPNMPALLGAGMSAYCVGNHASAYHRRLAEHLLGAIGEVVQVKESAMDLVTAISGSGPAYYFLLSEKMIEAACEFGLKASVAKKLVYQTALGSARVQLKSEEDPDVLIERVASKKGTTEAALKVFRRKGFAKIVQDAISAARKRSEELSQ